MLALLYIGLAWFIGYRIFQGVISPIIEQLKPSILHHKASPPQWMIALPGGFLIGIIFTTWLTYLGAYSFAHTPSPLGYGNRITFMCLLLVCGLGYIKYPHGVRGWLTKITKLRWQHVWAFCKNNTVELSFCVVALLLSAGLMLYTLHMRENTLFIGGWVYSDFGPHLSLIRSFSYGANFPTEYPHFANGRIQYHFLFHFLAGNLEFLGLPLDWAFNLPSILSLTAFLMLFYALVVLLTGVRAVAFMALGLMLFRSSFSLFEYLVKTFYTSNPPQHMELPPVHFLVFHLADISKWVGTSPYEEWGLWALPSIFVNQRHNAIALGVLLLTFIVMLPLFRQMMQSLASCKSPWGWLKELLGTRNAWLPTNTSATVLMGILLGLTSFWNGAIVMGALVLLFGLALASKHRLSFLIIAGLTVGLTSLQTEFFMGGFTRQVFQPEVAVGLFASQRTFLGIWIYYLSVFGLLPLAALAGMLVLPKGSRWLVPVFLMPVVVATFFKFSPDHMNNHKLVHISVILLNIGVALLLYRLIVCRQAIAQCIAQILIVMLTITGIVDACSFINLNRRYLTFDLKDPLLTWTRRNTAPNDLFLTDIHGLHPVLLAGRKLFLGWSYYAWAAGYDTPMREAASREMFAAADMQRTHKLLRTYNIKYILIEDGLRHSTMFSLNEAAFKQHFTPVYQDDNRHITVYQVNTP